MKQSKVIINCAITGSIHIPTQTPYLPITPQQIADEQSRLQMRVQLLYTCTPETLKQDSRVLILDLSRSTVPKSTDVLM